MARSVATWITGRRVKYLVIVFWLVMVAVAAPLASKLTSVEKNEATSWLPGSAESTKVLKAQSAFASPEVMPAVIVFERTSGLTDADRAKVTTVVRDLGKSPVLGGEITGPIPSGDGQAMQLIVPLNFGKDGWATAEGIVADVRRIATADANGLAVHIGGPAGSTADSSGVFKGLDSTLLYGTIGVVVLILLLTYRSPTLWLLPILSAGFALVTAQAAIYLLAKHAGLTVNAQSASILTVLVFGAGTDYALLLVARYREELRKHADRHEAMAVALHRAGPAIVASAATVAIGMSCLTLAETNSTKGLGPVTAIGVVIGLCVTLTLLPALLVSAGRWVFWPVRPTYGSAEPAEAGLWARVGRGIARVPRLTWIGTTIVLAMMAIGIVQLDATGLTSKESFRTRPDSITAEETMARHFAADSGNPVVVISDAAAAPQVRQAFAATRGIDPGSVTEPIVKGDVAYLQGMPEATAGSQSAFDIVDRVRSAVHGVAGAHALVGGNSAVNLDMQRAAKHDQDVIIPVVLVVVFVILGLLLRAVFAPLLLVGTVVLSFAAALGASALVFRHVYGFGGADASLPLFVFVFLVALGIDYNIFLMTRVREEALRHGTRRGALIGLTATGGVITSAGFVLAGTFAVLATLPLTAFAEVGFAVAFGVLLDTIVVRSILVTALNLDIGRHVWWPSRLGTKPDEQPHHDPQQSMASITASSV